ncbi:hypothetical protein HDV06_006214 [Boothiomyces sp. JEL0866]|nr:hypothetical protein HDV06_006214 [Boothiomyces sp. JEL0866]
MMRKVVFKQPVNFLNTMTRNTINFYRQNDPYGEFSNFYIAEIQVGGTRWPTTEHYFQAQKFPNNPEIMKSIQDACTPGVAAKLGRNRQYPLRKDWEAVKEDVMMDALRAKFTQHEQLKKLLVQTGDATLVEHTRNDSYWGDGGNGTGNNRLGILLMKLRSELQGESSEWVIC